MAATAPASAEEVMPIAAIKALLAKARRGEAVNCAIALTTDKDAVLLLDRKKKPRKLSEDMKQKAKDAGLDLAMATVRFGRAEIDGEEDARTVRFLINKEGPGAFKAKLAALLRPAGFGRAEVVVDEGQDTETDTGEADDAEDSAGLQAALAAAGKSGVVWDATLKNVQRQVSDLLGKLEAAYEGHGFAAELGQVFRAKVSPMLDTMDASLEQKLAAIATNPDPAARGQALSEAQQIIGRYADYLASEPLIAKLDANPLQPMSIGKTLATSLEALRRTLGKVQAETTG